MSPSPDASEHRAGTCEGEAAHGPWCSLAEVPDSYSESCSESMIEVQDRPCVSRTSLPTPDRGYPGARRSGNASPEGSSGACVLAIGEGFSHFGQNCCTLLRAAQGAAGSKGRRLRPDWRGVRLNALNLVQQLLPPPPWALCPRSSCR